MCSILSDLITSTMKSELGLPTRCGISFGTAVSLAICCTPGGTAAGSRFTSAAVIPGVAALATLVDAAAPATAAPARNLRRLTSGWERLRAMVSSKLPRCGESRGRTCSLTLQSLGQNDLSVRRRAPCRRGARQMSHDLTRNQRGVPAPRQTCENLMQGQHRAAVSLPPRALASGGEGEGVGATFAC